MKRKGARFCGYSCSSLWRHANRERWAPSGRDHYAYRETLDKYGSLHARIGRERGAATECEMRTEVGCASETYEWAHVHGTDAQDVNNYRQLCKSCHVTYDNQRGAGHAMSKLTWEQADEIRERYGRGAVSQRALADEFGVGQTAVSRIVRGLGYVRSN